MTGIHFQSEIVPGGRWSRLQGTTPRGGSDEPRPHLVPITDQGRRIVEMEASQFFGRTRLCPGQITRDDGSTTLAYRFINLPETEVESLIDQLDEMVEEIERSLRD